MPSKLIPSFNAGEISPYVDARSDLEKYDSGCQTLENFIILPYGGIYRRPGTEFLGEAKVSDTRCRLIGFNFSTSTRFILELGEHYIRFWTNGTPVFIGDDPLELVTPYLEGELREIQYTQINDVMYLVHPKHPPHKLSRLADDDWTFAPVAWDWPALLDENAEATTIAASATTGVGVTLTASADLFDQAHVGSFWQLAHLRPKSYVERDINGTGTSNSLRVLGKWEFTTYGNWNGEILLERSYDNGATWEMIRSYKSVVDFNASTTGEESRDALLRFNITSYSGGNTNPRGLISAQDAKIYGIVKITAVSSATIAVGDVVRDLYATTATKTWSEGAWSAKRGYPRTIALHESRIFYAGTTSRPQSLWGSAVDDFDNLRLSSLDNAGLFFTISSPQSNAIQWLVSQSKLLIGTAGDEWTLSSANKDGPITPGDVQARRQSSYGSKYMRALVVNDVILFVQRQGRKVRELVYAYEQDGYKAPDLTVLAEHVTTGEILECAFQQQPDAIYWTITGAGQLAGMTYERDQNVVGWHRHVTDGEFESVATVYGANGADEVWFAVKRTINGQTKRYIERFAPNFRAAFDNEDKPNWWYLDCARSESLDGKHTLDIPLNSGLQGSSFQYFPAHQALTCKFTNTTGYPVEVQVGGGPVTTYAPSDPIEITGITNIDQIKVRRVYPADVVIDTGPLYPADFGPTGYETPTLLGSWGYNIHVWNDPDPGGLSADDTLVLNGVKYDDIGYAHALYGGVATNMLYLAAGTELWLNVYNYGGTRSLSGNLRLMAEKLPDTLKIEYYYPISGDTLESLAHLEGKTVDILADGAVSPSRVVAGGEITLQSPAEKAIVGLPFISTVKPMKIEVPMPDGASRGRKKRVIQVVASLYKSLGGQASTDGVTWETIYTRSFSGAMDASPAPVSGDVEIVVAGDTGRAAEISLRQKQPLPLTLLALVPVFEIRGDGT